MTDNASAKGRLAPAAKPVARAKLHRYRSAKAKPREVEIVSSDYQPSAAELEEDVRVDATFDQAVDALTKPVSIRYMERPKPAK